MILSGHQPVYLPSIQLFNKIALSDKFMFVGHCAFEDGSWHNRNRWRGSGPFATIPIKHGATCINEAEFINDRWKKKHLRSIELNYSKRPYFDFYFGSLRWIIVNSENLAFLNKALIDAICKWLQIKTEIVDSTAFDLEYSTKNGMLAAMCKATELRPIPVQ